MMHVRDKAPAGLGSSLSLRRGAEGRQNVPQSESLFVLSYSKNNNGVVFFWCQLQPFTEIALNLMAARDARKRR